MHNPKSERIARAQWLLGNSKHAAMATVNQDGSPHNTPYLFMRSDDLTEVYWGSHPDSAHSQNILRTGQLFIVLYEANEPGGLYIRCKNGRIAEGEELHLSLDVHNSIRSKYGSKPLPLAYYQPPSEQRMWLAQTDAFWVNYAQRDSSGRVRQDKRLSINREDLFS